jgi:uncharacterized protein affecting Mg2+/Co2+ transport
MNEPDLNNIEVDVETRYIEDQSNPEQNYYVFAYTITIQNRGRQAAQLLTRHWVITDSNQKVQEVRGDGVVGEQPLLKPGEQFVYTSGTRKAAIKCWPTMARTSTRKSTSSCCQHPGYCTRRLRQWQYTR